jgi:fatty acid desaturase
MPAAIKRAARAYAGWFNTGGDARRLIATIWICYLLLYGQFALALAGLLPLWSMAVTAPIWIVRWLLATHELLHLRSEYQLDPILRLQPLLLTPFSLGYKEFLSYHRGHHRHMATPADPEFYQLRGNKLCGLLNAMSAPEQSFLRWLRREKIDRELVLGTTLRCGLFFALLWFSGWNFLWYWIPVRVAFGLSYFAFFYVLHRRGEEYGVYALDLPAWGARLFGFLFGREALLATCHHDAHHHQPRVSAYRLPEMTALQPPPQ